MSLLVVRIGQEINELLTRLFVHQILSLPVRTFCLFRLHTWLELPILLASQAGRVLWTSRSLLVQTKLYRPPARASAIQRALRSR